MHFSLPPNLTPWFHLHVIPHLAPLPHMLRPNLDSCVVPAEVLFAFIRQIPIYTLLRIYDAYNDLELSCSCEVNRSLRLMLNQSLDEINLRYCVVIGSSFNLEHLQCIICYIIFFLVSQLMNNSFNENSCLLFLSNIYKTTSLSKKLV